MLAPVRTLSLTQNYTQWVPGLFPGVKRPGYGVERPPRSRPDVKERVELYIFTYSGPPWPVLG